MPKHPLAKLIALILLTLAYVGAGKLGLRLAFLNESASAVWPPSGLALAAMLLLGYGIWPAVFTGAFIVNWTTNGSVGPSLAIAGGNTAEALLGAFLTFWLAGGVAAFDRAEDIFRFVFFVAVPSTAVAATVGVTSLALAGGVRWDIYVPVWVTWWTGDFVSQLVITPLLVIWLGRRRPWPDRRHVMEGVALVLLLFALSASIFAEAMLWKRNYPLEYLSMPLLLWAAFRFHQRGAVTAAFIMSAVAIFGTLKGTGPFAVGNRNDSLVLLQTFIGIITMTALVMAAVVTEHETIQQDRERALEREQSARTDAERANEAKDRFLAILSHELRTPLTPIMLATSLLDGEKELSAAGREVLETIRRSVELEARLIDDLLDLSRIVNAKMSLRMQPVAVHELIRAAMEMVRPEAEQKRLSVNAKLDSTNDRVTADPARLQQVFWNVLKNAVKFTPQDGQITVSTSNDGAAQLVVQIRDTGVGIASEQLPRVFAAFDQGGHNTLRRFGGLGLGLAISKAITEMHGGRITAESEGENHGAVFTLTLPTTSRTHGGGAPSNLEYQPARNMIRVLLVEDHPETLKMLRRLLEASGLAVVTAPTVAAATTAIENSAFDVLVSDIGLPDGSGNDLLRAIKSHGITLPAIAISGYGTEHDVRDSKDAGFASHMIKPIDVPELVSAIRNMASTKGISVP